MFIKDNNVPGANWRKIIALSLNVIAFDEYIILCYNKKINMKLLEEN
jgi:hypothetical protein